MKTYDHEFSVSYRIKVIGSAYEDGSDCLQQEAEWVVCKLEEKLEPYLKGKDLNEICDLENTIEFDEMGYDPLKEKTKNDLVVRV